MLQTASVIPSGSNQWLNNSCVESTNGAGLKFADLLFGLFGVELQKRGESINYLGARTTEYFDEEGGLTASIDPLGRSIYNIYDGAHRLKKKIFPEGDSIEYTYDARGNRLTEKRNSKNDAGNNIVSETVRTYTYKDGPNVASCAIPKTCNLIASEKDAKGNTTTYDYNSYGQLMWKKGPTSVGDRTDYCYRLALSGTDLPVENRTI